MSRRRAEMIRRLADGSFDLLVIGGGITGVGIAQDAAHRGLRVALVEKGDFASGTTHASTKLLHGGLRYLEQLQFKLMYEALHERNRLTRLAPELAEWLPFLIPIYGLGWRTERLGAGLWLYDLLAGLPRRRLHCRISAEDALRLAPWLRRDGLQGAYLYYDCRTDDTRLAMAVLRSALHAGAVAANYAAVTGFICEQGAVRGVTVADAVGGNSFPVRAQCVVNATGPWTDWTLRLDEPDHAARLKPSKGVHIIVPAERLPVEAAVLAPSPTGDQRFIFIVPWHGAVLLGTTDTPYHDHPDTVAADAADIEYILAAANHAFPQAELTSEDVVSVIAGLRPLLRADTKGGATAQLPREHKIWVSESGVVSVAGGKLTTYRTMAAQVTDTVLRRLGRPYVPCTTARIHLEQDRTDALHELVAAEPDLQEPVVPGLPYTRADVAFAAREELAVYPEDVLYRRTRAALLDRHCAERQRDDVAALLTRFG